MKLSSINTITIKIKKAIDNNEPFSLVRLGDGEFIVIKYPKTTSEKALRDRVSRWFDSSGLSVKQIRSIRNQIYRACLNANILGIPSVREQKIIRKWKSFETTAKQYKLIDSKKLYFHFYRIQQINYKYLFKDIRELNCITCRDIRSELKSYFDLDRVNMFLLPSENFVWNARIEDKNKQTKARGEHYPTIFKKIALHLQNNDLSGKVFIVGAGGLGKAYCNMIKASGGIALDIGALFDGWAGLCSRPFLKNPKRFKL